MKRVAQHYRRVILAENTANTWTEEEEEKLIEHVQRNGTAKWSVLAQKINRTGILLFYKVVFLSLIIS